MKSQRMLEVGEGWNWSRVGPSELVRTGGVREDGRASYESL